MPRYWSAAAAALLAAIASPSALASCYVVYGPDADIVYRASRPPVDLSRPIHETLPAVAPGGTLVFTPDRLGCDVPVNKLPLAAAAQPGAGATPGLSGAGGRGARADRG